MTLEPVEEGCDETERYRSRNESMEVRASESWLRGRMELSRVEERRRRAKWVGR